MPWTCSEAVSSTERHTRDTDSSTMTDSEMSSLRTPMGRLTGSQERQEASRGCWATAHSRRCGRGMLRGDGAGGQGSPQGTRPGPLFLRTSHHHTAPPPPPTAASTVSRPCPRQQRHTPTHTSHGHVPPSQVTTRQPPTGMGQPRGQPRFPSALKPTVPPRSQQPRPHLAPRGLPEQVLLWVHLPGDRLTGDLEGLR